MTTIAVVLSLWEEEEGVADGAGISVSISPEVVGVEEP